MPDTIVEFFDQLGRRGYEALLDDVSGTLRFDVTDGDRVEHWLVSIDGGNVSVSHSQAPADCVVRLDRAVLESLIQGRAVAQAVWLRDLLVAGGRLVLMRRFERIFSGPPDAHDPRELVAHRSGRR